MKMYRTHYTPPEAAEILQVCHITVYRWLNTGALRGVKSDHKWIILHADLMKFGEKLYKAPRHRRSGSWEDRFAFWVECDKEHIASIFNEQRRTA